MSCDGHTSCQNPRGCQNAGKCTAHLDDIELPEPESGIPSGLSFVGTQSQVTDENLSRLEMLIEQAGNWQEVVGMLERRGVGGLINPDRISQIIGQLWISDGVSIQSELPIYSQVSTQKGTTNEQ